MGCLSLIVADIEINVVIKHTLEKVDFSLSTIYQFVDDIVCAIPEVIVDVMKILNSC